VLRKSADSILLDLFGRRVFEHGGRIVKYGESVLMREVEALAFIKSSGLEVPVPEVYSAGSCGPVQVIEMQLIKGVTLESIWSQLCSEEKTSYALQLRKIVNQLRSLQGECIGSFARCPAVDYSRDRHVGGPFDTEAAFNDFLLSNTISTTPPIHRQMLRDLLAERPHRFLLTHGDLTPSNIIVDGRGIVGIIDCEDAGWYPEHWEFLQFLRSMYRNYRDYGEVIFETFYPDEFMVDNFIGHLTRH
jgi:aminoglycoside phosphotransferase